MTGFHSAGSWLSHREVVDGRVWLSYPVRVVAHSATELVIFVARGTPLTFGLGVGPRGEHPWQVLGDRWLSRGVLRIHPPGAGHIVEARWDDQNRLSCWYVNFQEPLRLVPGGYETLDHELDLIIEPDLGGLRLKDGVDFAEQIHSGAIHPRTAATVLNEAGGLIERIGRGNAWWDRDWATWRPPTGWEEWKR